VGEGSCYRLVKDSWPWGKQGEEATSNIDALVTDALEPPPNKGYFHSFVLCMEAVLLEGFLPYKKICCMEVEVVPCREVFPCP
jgi:hypothetical protein